MAGSTSFSRIQHRVPDSVDISPRGVAEISCLPDSSHKALPFTFAELKSKSVSSAAASGSHSFVRHSLGVSSQATSQHSLAVSSWNAVEDGQELKRQSIASQDSIKSAVLVLRHLSSRRRRYSLSTLSSEGSMQPVRSLGSLSTSSSAHVVATKSWMVQTSVVRSVNSTWSRLVPENDSITQIFAHGQETPGIMMKVSIMGVFLFVFAMITGLLSDRTSVGIGCGFGVPVYCALSRSSIFTAPLFMISCMSAFFFRVANLWNRPGHLLTTVATSWVLFYLFLAATAFLTREFPVIPLGIVMLHLPIAVVFVRGVLARAYDPAKVYNTIFLTCSLIAALLFICCGVSMSFNGERLDSETQEVLRQSLEECEQDFASEAQACANEPPDSRSVDACSKLDLVGFLIWVTPLVESILFMAFALFCAFRAWFLSKHALRQLSIIVHIAVGFAHLIVVAFWIATSVSGINREMSLAILFLVGISCFGFLVWVYFSIVLSDLIACALDEPLVAVFAPLLASDEFKGCVFSVAFAIAVPFLLLEAIVRRCQRMFQIPGSHAYLTPSALKILQVVEGWNWSLVLEQAFWWDLFFVLAWVCCSQLTVVLMAGIKDALEDTSFEKCCCMFFVAVLAFFTAIPIPGIPIYFCFGSIIVRQACKESHLNFTSGVFIACMLTWLLKLTAVSIQLSLGKLLRRSTRVQGALGIHRSWVRAMRGILTTRGVTLDKVFIICGGPDWPTSILAGILNISWREMMLSLLPTTAIILPSVFAGALFGEASWSTTSRVLIAIMTLMQGMLLFGACYVVLRVMQREAEELKLQRRPSMEALFEHVKQQSEIVKLTSLCSEWTALNLPCQVLLVCATLAELICCWILFFLSALCFREFNILSDFHAPLDEGGLNGKPWNLVTSFGACALGLSALGMCLMAVYYALMRRSMQEVLHSTAALKEWQSTVAQIAPRVVHSCPPCVDDTLPRQTLRFRGTPSSSACKSFDEDILLADEG